jgi:hypothetical protein
MLVFVGVALIALAVLAVFAQLREKAHRSLGRIRSGDYRLRGYFRGVEDGNEALGWFTIPIVLVVLPLIRPLFAKDSETADVDKEQ